MTEDPAAAAPAQFAALACPLQPDVVRAVVAEIIHLCHFLVSQRLALQQVGPLEEEVVWEVFQGRLLDAAHTRQRQTFESWNVFQIDAQGRSAEPILSVKLDRPAGRLHVVRAIHCYGWEAYDAGNQVILSRETQKWTRELVGTVELSRATGVTQLRDTLAGLLFQAVVGTSRLPLTSLEGPLPAFSLGDLAYFHQPGIRAAPRTTTRELIDGALVAERSWREKAKLLEAVLRFTAVADLPSTSQYFSGRWRQIGLSAEQLTALLRTVFNDVALSPYTDFVDKSLTFVDQLVASASLDVEAQLDFLSSLLRHLARHLTAYDLVVFHHRGANYPDALLLDAVLRAYLLLAERHPTHFTPAPADTEEDGRRKRLRRRGFRMGVLLRWQYEGHPVPDVPTSPGENCRVLPAPFGRVPEEQITDPRRRGRQLFVAEPLPLGEIGQMLLRQSIADLQHAAELRELGSALFLDRPLGVHKRPGEQDGTTLLSHVAFSRSIAARRLEFLAKRVNDDTLRGLEQRLGDAALAGGLAIQPSGLPARPGVATLDDALRVAGDFVLLGTTRQTVEQFFGEYGLAALALQLGIGDLLDFRRLLIVGSANLPGRKPGQLCIFDRYGQQRLELDIDARLGYCGGPATEHPEGGVRVLHVWQSSGSRAYCASADQTTLTFSPT